MEPDPVGSSSSTSATAGGRAPASRRDSTGGAGAAYPVKRGAAATGHTSGLVGGGMPRIVAAVPSIPVALGWTGAAGDAGASGSTQRRHGGWQASCPMLGVYASTYVALLAAACWASIAFSSFSLARRYGTSA